MVGGWFWGWFWGGSGVIWGCDEGVGVFGGDLGGSPPNTPQPRFSPQAVEGGGSHPAGSGRDSGSHTRVTHVFWPSVCHTRAQTFHAHVPGCLSHLYTCVLVMHMCVPCVPWPCMHMSQP